MKVTMVIGFSAILVLLAASSVVAYDAYRMSGGNASCYNCHNGFRNEGPLHDLHVGSSQMTGTCTRCHTSVGDIPKTWTSGSGDGCRGCHGRNNGPGFTWSAGLRLHHANAGAPADINGQYCVDCHTNDPVPDPENTLPPYYGQPDVNISDPCVSTGAGGEDFNNDGVGLDNDGDLLYDENDSDCGATGLGDTPEFASALRLNIYPNPAIPGVTRVRYELQSAADVEVAIYDLQGKLVESRVYPAAPAGVNNHLFRGTNAAGHPLPTGVYLVRVTADAAAATAKMVILK